MRYMYDIRYAYVLIYIYLFANEQFYVIITNIIIIIISIKEEEQNKLIYKTVRDWARVQIGSSKC